MIMLHTKHIALNGKGLLRIDRQKARDLLENDSDCILSNKRGQLVKYIRNNLKDNIFSDVEIDLQDIVEIDMAIIGELAQVKKIVQSEPLRSLTIILFKENEILWNTFPENISAPHI